MNGNSIALTNGKQKDIALIAHDNKQADFMITSSYMEKEYENEIINLKKNIKERSETL